jgi:hypothetical protein
MLWSLWKSDRTVTESMKAEQDGLPTPQRYWSAATTRQYHHYPAAVEMP